MNAYFTYGDNGEYPFDGGWSEISASSIELASALHRGLHPYHLHIGRSLNCANVFTEDKFKSTRMYENLDNHGAACQEFLKVTSHCCCVGDDGYWVHTGYMCVCFVIVTAINEENPDLVSLDVFLDVNNSEIVRIDNVPKVDIFEEKEDAEAFKQQLLRYINRRVTI